MARAQTEIHWEEDKRNKRKDSSSSRYEERFLNPPKRAKDSEIIAWRPLDRNGRRIMENRPRNREYDSIPSAYTIRGQAASSRPRLPDYNFTVSPGDLVSILKRMGDTVRWPQRPRDGPSKKDTTKWCEFHRDYGHTTADCVALRLEVLELLNKGHLKDLLTERGKSTMARREERARDDGPPRPPPIDNTVNCITGGSEISGVSYSAAKRHSRRVSSGASQSTINMEEAFTNLTIGFIDDQDSIQMNPPS